MIFNVQNLTNLFLNMDNLILLKINCSFLHFKNVRFHNHVSHFVDPDITICPDQEVATATYDLIQLSLLEWLDVHRLVVDRLDLLNLPWNIVPTKFITPA